MPRKQRFKPSRKPKPAPQSEALPTNHEVRTSSQDIGSQDENAESGGSSSHMRDDLVSQEPDIDSSSR